MIEATALEEAQPNRLEAVSARLKREQEAAPEFPPPLQLEQLAATKIEAEMEEIMTLEADKSEARQRLEKVFEKPKEAAEVAKPIEELPEEAQLERRAEIRQDDPPVEDSGLAHSIGQVLADLHQKTAAAHAAFGAMRPKRFKIKLPALPAVPLPSVLQQLPALYQKAVLGGFGGAVLILAGWAIFA